MGIVPTYRLQQRHTGFEGLVVYQFEKLGEKEAASFKFVCRSRLDSFGGKAAWRPAMNFAIACK